MTLIPLFWLLGTVILLTASRRMWIDNELSNRWQCLIMCIVWSLVDGLRALFRKLSMFGIGKYITLGAAIALALSLAWGFRVDHLRDGWRTRYITETGEVTATIRRVTENDSFQWKDANQQIELLADSRNEWKSTAGEQTAVIDHMGAETARLKQLNAEYRAKAEKEIAKRKAAIDRLESQAQNPGDRENCQEQIAAANAALDLIYEEGL